MAVSLGDLTHCLLQPLFEKNPHFSLLLQWPTIVGRDIAHYTRPGRIIEIKGAQGPEAILYLHTERRYGIKAWSFSTTILERVNTYIGHGFVKRLRFVMT